MEGTYKILCIEDKEFLGSLDKFPANGIQRIPFVTNYKNGIIRLKLSYPKTQRKSLSSLTFIFLGEGGNLVFLSIKCGYKKVSTSSLFNVQHSCLRPQMNAL
jgi:hypothetical protein